MRSVAEVTTPEWVGKCGRKGPAYVVTRIPPWQAAVLVTIPAIIFLAVALMSGGQAVAATLVADAFLITGAALIASRYRFLAGGDWLASETILGHHLVRLDALVKADVYSSATSAPARYLRLHDREGGSIAIDSRTVLPRIRDLVQPALLRATENGDLQLDARTKTLLGLEI